MKNQLFYNCVAAKGQVPDNYQAAGGLSTQEAFAVYQRGYVARLTETLGDTYESVWSVLGDDLFFEVCREFIFLHSSLSYNLSDYSVKFIDFLISHPISQEFPFLADLAHLGWLHKKVFHAATEQALAGEELITLLGNDDKKLMLVSDFDVLKSDFCLFDIWKSLKNESVPPEKWQNPQCLAFYKLDQQVYVQQISIKEFEFFEHLRSGLDIIDACECLTSTEITSLFHFLKTSRCLKRYAVPFSDAPGRGY